MAVVDEVTVVIDTREINDSSTFHEVFKERMGFPEFYGRNMDAWIDCMGCDDSPEAAMSTIRLKAGQKLILHLEHAVDFNRRCPELFNHLVDCTDFVNSRRGQPVLFLKMD